MLFFVTLADLGTTAFSIISIISLIFFFAWIVSEVKYYYESKEIKKEFNTWMETNNISQQDLADRWG